ncbi:hypothetical protein AB5I41_07730 [Sphingomonas sp. MMS24-JH45]
MFTGTGTSPAPETPPATPSPAARNDRLDGGAGNDTMSGGWARRHLMPLDSSGDMVVEAASAGIDTVETTAASYTLSSNVEKLTYTGSGTFAGTGNALANVIAGGNQADILDGGDRERRAHRVRRRRHLRGRQRAGDTVVEAANGGTDTVRSTAAAYDGQCREPRHPGDQRQRDRQRTRQQSDGSVATMSWTAAPGRTR